MTVSPGIGVRPGGTQARQLPGGARPLVVTGAIAAGTVSVSGLGVLTPFVLAGWIAAPRSGAGLMGVLRTASLLWLAAHHVGFALHGTGRIGMLPLGLVLVPGALLWAGGRWVVRAGGLSRLTEVGYAALALAAPYAAISGALALASGSRAASPSPVQAVVAGFLLAFVAGGLGAARAVAPWGRLARLLPPRPRSVVLGTVGSLAVLGAGGAVLVGASIAAHQTEFARLTSALAPGWMGAGLLLLIQLAYVPNAVTWAVCYCLGPGFAFGIHTVVAPTGSALGPLPLFPLLAALPSGGGSVPAWAAAGMLALPYVAGAFGGVLLVRAAPAPAFEIAPLWGFVCGVGTGVVLAVLAAFSGGPLGSARLVTVGPSAWQTGLVAVLEDGVAAAVAAGVANWLFLRRNPPAAGVTESRQPSGEEQADHHIYLDPWADPGDDWDDPEAVPPSPSDLP
ncbi:MAG TPA: DUF6350 family protein [Streptosporangiaceae bacterium]|nr:DUF6350 family protein [Streptosporangiaceae bacterium]